MHVADTHSWLWYLSEDPRLGEKAEQAFQSADLGEEKIILPTIVITESVYIAKKKDYDLQMKKIIEDLKVSSNYITTPISYSILTELVSDNRKLSIHDKIITLTAETENYNIITKDKEITKKSKTKVIW